MSQEGLKDVFFKAAKEGKIEKLKECLERKVDVNTTHKKGYTALHIACSKRQYECAKLLLQNKAEVNALSGIHSTSPLHEAAEAGYPDIVKLLLEYGANVCHKNNYRDTALHFLVKENPDTKNIHYLIEIIQMLHGHGISLDAKNDAGQTALHKACVHKEYAGVVKKLLELGANKDIRNNHGETPLELANIKIRGSEICDLLLTMPVRQQSPVNAVADGGKPVKLKQEIRSLQQPSTDETLSPWQETSHEQQSSSPEIRPFQETDGTQLSETDSTQEGGSPKDAVLFINKELENGGGVRPINITINNTGLVCIGDHTTATINQPTKSTEDKDQIHNDNTISRVMTNEKH